MVLKNVEEKGEKNSSLFCKICKMTNHNAEKCWHKGKPNVTFVKSLATLKRIVGTRNGSNQIFVKNRRKKGKKTFSLLLYLMLQQKATNGMLIVVVVIT